MLYIFATYEVLMIPNIIVEMCSYLLTFFRRIVFALVCTNISGKTNSRLRRLQIKFSMRYFVKFEACTFLRNQIERE
ncbi:hypothetical protein KFK09_024062 [Dendrobium nobile]|uniref:Uncharacterized protein n=1 Tax=Dendrobium nobile TaxID=94219 RepID=A0A8T3AI85_DENNO|nr:hypothetical protein KFK09_024062 [Dendrobium nobile]